MHGKSSFTVKKPEKRIPARETQIRIWPRHLSLAVLENTNNPDAINRMIYRINPYTQVGMPSSVEHCSLRAQVWEMSLV
jgi:glucose-6-phosphate 1-dehydrogenase